MTQKVIVVTLQSTRRGLFHQLMSKCVLGSKIVPKMIQKVTKKTLNCLRNRVFQDHICIQQLTIFRKVLTRPGFAKPICSTKTIAQQLSTNSGFQDLQPNTFQLRHFKLQSIPQFQMQCTYFTFLEPPATITTLGRVRFLLKKRGGTFFTQKTWGGSEGRAATIWRKHVMEASSTSSQTIWQIFCSIPSFLDASLRKHYEDSVCARTLSTLPDIDKCVLILQYIMIHSVSYIEHRYISNQGQGIEDQTFKDFKDLGLGL